MMDMSLSDYIRNKIRKTRQCCAVSSSRCVLFYVYNTRKSHCVFEKVVANRTFMLYVKVAASYYFRNGENLFYAVVVLFLSVDGNISDMDFRTMYIILAQYVGGFDDLKIYEERIVKKDNKV